MTPANKKTSLMTHVVAGYPTMEDTENLVLAMSKVGVSFIEIQIPFSDPVADGPTIMRANQHSLEQGTTPEDCVNLMARLSARIDTPLLFMTYFNIVYKYGVQQFCRRTKEAGGYGLIIPDMPYHQEPQEHFLDACRTNDLNAIQVISPITPKERLKEIARVSSGFVYCVSRAGTTGEQKELNSDLSAYLKRVRKTIQLPLALGFGISSVDQVRTASQLADIVVIGSRIINIVNESTRDSLLDNVSLFIRGLLEPDQPQG